MEDWPTFTQILSIIQAVSYLLLSVYLAFSAGLHKMRDHTNHSLFSISLVFAYLTVLVVNTIFPVLDTILVVLFLTPLLFYSAIVSTINMIRENINNKKENL